MSRRKEKYAMDPRPLGRGGQAEVFRARDKQTGEYIALKRIISRYNTNAIARMRREITVQTEICHPNVMPILDSSTSYIWYTMPLADKTLQNLTPPLNDTIILEIVQCISQGLLVAHLNGFIHRDVKPSNILLLDEEKGNWVISDWGLVRTHGRTTETRTAAGNYFGTAGYAAPELYMDAHNADEGADVYSLGRVVVWCLTGDILPPNIPVIPDGIWSDFVKKTTEPNRLNRVSDMQTILTIVEPIKKLIGVIGNEEVTYFEPIKIVNVIEDEVTLPRGDGSRGSGLYAIPFQLSREPPYDWVKIFTQTWNNPPRYSTMHRKGIAKVVGDSIVLDGTTIEEIKHYHLETLKLAVKIANEECEKSEKQKQLKKIKELDKSQKHSENIRKIANDLDFDLND